MAAKTKSTRSKKPAKRKTIKATQIDVDFVFDQQPPAKCLGTTSVDLCQPEQPAYDYDQDSIKIVFDRYLAPEQRLQLAAQMNNAVKIVFGSEVFLGKNDNNRVLNYRDNHNASNH